MIVFLACQISTGANGFLICGNIGDIAVIPTWEDKAVYAFTWLYFNFSTASILVR